MSSRVERAAASLRDSLAILVSRSFPTSEFDLFMAVAAVQFRADESCKSMAVALAGKEVVPEDPNATAQLNEASGLVSVAEPSNPPTVRRAITESNEGLDAADAYIARIEAGTIA